MSIDIRIVSTANVANATRELGKLAAAANATQTAMQGKIDKTPFIQTDQRIKQYRTYGVQMDNLRGKMNDATRAVGDFSTASYKVGKDTDTMVDKIRKGQLSFRDLRKEGDLLNRTYQDQMKLQSSYARTWGKTAAGNTKVDLVTPNFEVAGRGWDQMRTKVGFYNEVLKSVSTNTVNWGKNTQWSGRQLMAGITYPLTIAAGVMAKTAYDVDKGLTQITKVYGDSASAIQETDDEIKKAAMSTAKNMTQYGQSVNDTLEIQSQLASTGQTGQELQDATEAVTKARLLGELDIQDAMKATITIQEVYGKSGQELADTFNFMNKMENETSLTMQDFVEGIPKISGIMKELDAPFEQTGIMLAAMKTAGIDAAEGGTAIKSMVFKDIAPTGKALKTWTDIVGTVAPGLDEIAASTGGDPVKTFQEIGKAIKGLSNTEKVTVFKEVFGIHQGGKALGMVRALTEQTGQMGKAFEIAGMSTGEWADTANAELETLKKADWVKVTKAIEDVKIGMVQFGKAILHEVAPALQWIADKMAKAGEWFDGLDSGTKKWSMWGVAALMATGPIIMLIGLFANLAGNAGKAASVLLNLSKGHGLVTTKERAATLAAQQHTKAVDSLTGALSRQFAQERSLAGMQLKKVNPNAAKAMNASLRDPKVVDAASAGSYMSPTIMAGAPKDLKDGANESTKITKEANKTGRAWRGISNNVGSLAVGAASIGMMTSSTDSLVGKISTAVFLGSLVGPSIYKGLVASGAIGYISKMALAINAAGLSAEASLSKKMGRQRMIGPLTKEASMAKGVMASLGTSIAALAGPVGIATIAIGGMFYLYKKRAKEAREEQEAFNGAVENLAKISGAQLRDPKTIKPGAKKSALDYETLAKEFLELDEKSAKYIQKMSESEKSKDAAIAYGIQMGNEARARGATSEASAETARIAAVAMNKEVADGIQLKIRATAFLDIDQVKINEVDRVRRMVLDEVKKETTGSWLTGSEASTDTIKIKRNMQVTPTGDSMVTGVLTEQLKTDLSSSVDAAYEQLADSTGKARQKVFQKMSSDAYAGLEDFYDGLSKEQKALMAKQGVFDAKSMSEWMDRSGGEGGLIDHLNKNGESLSNAQQDALAKNLAVYKELLIDYMMKTKDMTREQAEEKLGDTLNFDILAPKFNVKGAQASDAVLAGALKSYQDKVAEFRATGKKLSEAQQLGMLNDERVQAGLAKTTNLRDGMNRKVTSTLDAVKKETAANAYNAAGWKKAADNMKEYNDAKAGGKYDIFAGGIGTGVGDTAADPMLPNGPRATKEQMADTSAQYTDAYKNIYSRAADKMYARVTEEAENTHQANLDAIDAAAEKQSDALDAQQKKKEAEFDSRQEKIDAAFDKRQEKFDSKWDSTMESFDNKWEDKNDKFSEKWDATMENFDSKWDAKSDKFSAKWDSIMEDFDKKSEAAKKAVEAQYDARIKKVEDAIKAEQDAENTRQKIFEAEKARIQHMADMANRSIDISMSINSGDLDEAAKLSNDAQAASETYDIGDAGDDSQSVSDKVVESLENKKERLGKQKDAAIERIEARTAAEKKALEAQRKLAEKSFEIARAKERKILENQRKIAEKSMEIAQGRERKVLEGQRKREQKSLTSQRTAATKSLAAERTRYATNLEDQKKINARGVNSKRISENKKYALAKQSADDELEMLKAHTPRNEKELKAHIKRLNTSYGEFGGKLKTRGKKWSVVIGDSLVHETKVARNEMASKVEWDKLGQSIAGRMAKGAFGMSLNSFLKWVGKGAAPKLPKKAKSNANTSNKKRGVSGLTGVNRYGQQLHSGGIVGSGKSSRVGFSGKSQSQSEITINALKGESVLNRKATRALGAEGVDALNRGKISGSSNKGRKNQTGDGPGSAPGMMGGMMAMAFAKAAIEKAVMMKGTEQTAKDAAAAAMAGMSGGDWDGTSFGAFWKALGIQESGGNYSVVNSGTGALGKYQVMPANVGPWSREVLGKSVSTGQFLNSPDLQDKIVKGILGGYYRKWGPRGAAAAWYAGPGNYNLDQSTRSQPGGPSIKGYVDSIMGKMRDIQASSPAGVSPSGKGVYGYQKQIAWIKKAIPGTRITSSIRTGNLGGKSSTGSYHNRGRAIDMSDPARSHAGYTQIFNRLRSSFPNATELIYSPMGNRQLLNGRPHNYTGHTKAIHYDHVHWAMKNGGIVPGSGSGDKTRIMGEPGEFMMKKKAVEKVGPDYLRMLNSDRFINMPETAMGSVGSSGRGSGVDNSTSSVYNVSIDARGNAKAEDVKSAVKDVLVEIERVKGFNRRIGKN